MDGNCLAIADHRADHCQPQLTVTYRCNGVLKHFVEPAYSDAQAERYAWSLLCTPPDVGLTSVPAHDTAGESQHDESEFNTPMQLENHQRRLLAREWRPAVRDPAAVAVHDTSIFVQSLLDIVDIIFKWFAPAASRPPQLHTISEIFGFIKEAAAEAKAERSSSPSISQRPPSSGTPSASASNQSPSSATSSATCSSTGSALPSEPAALPTPSASSSTSSSASPTSSALQMFQQRMYYDAAIVSTVAGSGTPGGDDGRFLEASFFQPKGACLMAQGALAVLEYGGTRVRLLNLQTSIVSTLLAGRTELSAPYSLACAPNGTIYIANAGQNRRIAAVVPQQNGLPIVITVPIIDAATGTGYTFDSLAGLALHSSGALYAAEPTRNRVWCITSTTSHVFAGSGVRAYSDGPRLSAGIKYPIGLAFDQAGALYVVGGERNEEDRLQKVGTDGQVATLASNLHEANGVAVDSTGTIFVADTMRHVIRRISSDGNFNVIIAGQPDTVQPFSEGAGSAARFWAPMQIAMDETTGSLYVADIINQRVRRVIAWETPPSATPSPTATPVPSTTATASATASITPSSGSSTTTLRFNYTGSCITFTVPTGVSSLFVWLSGAAGGSAGSLLGGRGALVEGHLTVTSSQSLRLIIGRAGTFCPGAACSDAGTECEGGGGAGGSIRCGGSSGGGRTAVQTLQTGVWVDAAVAGGGGGAAGQGPGSDGMGSAADAFVDDGARYISDGVTQGGRGGLTQGGKSYVFVTAAQGSKGAAAHLLGAGAMVVEVAAGMAVAQAWTLAVAAARLGLVD